MSVVRNVPVPPTGILVIPRSAGNTLYRVGDLGFVKYSFEPVLEAANGDRTFIVDPTVALNALRPLAQLEGMLAAQRKRSKSKERAANITYSAPETSYRKPGELYELAIPLSRRKTDQEATVDQFEVDAIEHIEALFQKPYRADGVLYMLLAIRVALQEKDIETEAGILGVLREEAVAWLDHFKIDLVRFTQAYRESEGCYVLPMDACLVKIRTKTGRSTLFRVRDNLASCPHQELEGHVCVKFVKGSAVVCLEVLHVLALTQYQNDCIAFLYLLDPTKTEGPLEDVHPAVYHIRRAARWVFERYIEPEAVRLRLEAELKSAESLAAILPPCVRDVVEKFPETQATIKCAQRLHVGGVLRRLKRASAPALEYIRVFMKESPSKEEIVEIVKRKPKNRPRDEAFPCHVIRSNANLAVHPLNQNPCPYTCNLHCFRAHAGEDAPTHKCWTTPEEFVVYFARIKTDEPYFLCHLPSL